MVRALAAQEAGGKLEPYEYDPGDLGEDEVEISVETCGICHSDLSMLKDDWKMTEFPFVPGHEIVGKVKAVGEGVSTIEKGSTVGLGWFARSCMTCPQCMSGDHNLCSSAVGTIVGRHGGFADTVRAQATWVTPLPDGIDHESAGPLFCGGITVFNPIVQNAVSPVNRVGVVGIGGLGHMAIKFLSAWGCEVTAFSTTPEKESEAREFGAHRFVATRDEGALEKLSNSFDMILVTVNADLDWDAYVAALRPKGKLHLVGAAESVKATVFPLILGQKSVGASPLGSPVTTAEMTEFAARHRISPVVETFPMSEVNEAMDKLENGKPRYRIVLKNDL